MVEESQGQGGFDGEIRVAPLPTPPAAPAGRPGSDRLRGQPHRHIAASNECAVVGRPVRNAVLCLVPGMNLRLHPCSVAPAEGPEKCGPRRPTRAGPSCNNAVLPPDGRELPAVPRGLHAHEIRASTVRAAEGTAPITETSDSHSTLRTVPATSATRRPGRYLARRRGQSKRVAMLLTGHKTRAIFDRDKHPQRTRTARGRRPAGRLSGAARTGDAARQAAPPSRHRRPAPHTASPPRAAHHRVSRASGGPAGETGLDTRQPAGLADEPRAPPSPPSAHGAAR